MTIGTKEESDRFFKYYQEEQFENLIRPVENTVIMEAVCRRIGLDEDKVEREAQEEGKSHEEKSGF